ncbi:DUF2007 domain-containing protein [Bacteroidales bacterium OttesenSCG-928-C03]|nr:DUF2007 domain-containing protein [Bacteroidales bacterium OttesenSCG-928-C03]MDL2326849.1 DUF2007 domain-containing protein [Bacteroidales bacterium OttesenSCG-928-A14]
MDNWVKVMSFNYPHNAELAKNFLESKEIPSIVKGEMGAQAIGYFSPDGIELYVPQEHAEKAVALLKEGGF